MMPGETVATGAPTRCDDCGQEAKGPQVMYSAAGHYIGYECDCGPWSRESGYYKTAELAVAALESGAYGR